MIYINKFPKGDDDFKVSLGDNSVIISISGRKDHKININFANNEDAENVYNNIADITNIKSFLLSKRHRNAKEKYIIHINYVFEAKDMSCVSILNDTVSVSIKSKIRYGFGLIDKLFKDCNRKSDNPYQAISSYNRLLKLLHPQLIDSKLIIETTLEVEDFPELTTDQFDRIDHHYIDDLS